MKHILILTMLLFSTQYLFSESEDSNEKDNTNIIPLLFYKNLSLEKQNLCNYGGGLIIARGNTEADYTDKKKQSSCRPCLQR